MTISQHSVRNSFLRALSADDFHLIADYLVRTDLPRRHVLVQENEPIEHVYFPEGGLASVVALTPDREMIEVAAFGFEGVSDFVLEAGVDHVPLRTFMQVPGEGWRLNATPYAEALRKSQTFLAIVLRYDQYKVCQMAYSALSHGSYTIPERLARWVLIGQDRLGDEVKIAHEHLAMMLGVRRAGVTEAIHILEGHNAIKATRACIKVTDREKLLTLASGSYGVPEAVYRRLIGPMDRPAD